MKADELDAALRAYETSRTLLTAIELNVFTAVGPGATVRGVVERLETEPRATEALLNALVALGLLQKTDEVFSNGALAVRLLTDDSPENARDAYLHSVHRWDSWSMLTDRVRGVRKPGEYQDREPVRHEDLLARLEHRAPQLVPKMVVAVGTTGVRRLLDVGGGSAAFAIGFAQAGPEIEADVFDLPEVIPITQRYIDRAGMADRVRTRSGDLLRDELGKGYDLVLLCSVVHLLGAEENRSLLERCYRALTPGGRVAIHDHVLDASKTSPRLSALFSLSMLVTTPNGATYSLDEYRSWLQGAGFSETEYLQVEGLRGLLIATR